jgi:phosphoribosylformimino-5-aminoimidazole carboxamide ribotide isomerase
MRIRPCIDIHDGSVKQVVGSTVGSEKKKVKENFVSFRPASYYAEIYREKQLPGGHIVMLNSRVSEPLRYEADRQQALEALRAFPGGMQIGGGIGPETCSVFFDAGCSHIIVTSYVFRDGDLDAGRLREIQTAAGKNRLVLDLSCRRQADGDFVVCTDRWQKMTNLVVCSDTLEQLSAECGEFLIHAADVEGKQKGIETDLVEIIGGWLSQRARNGGDAFPVTYAGGVRRVEDVMEIRRLAEGRLDLTVGSALDLFGGSLSLDELTAAAASA